MTASFTNATTKSTAADLSITEVLDELVIDASYSARVLRPLCRNESVAGQPTDTKKFPRWPALAAAAVAETADLANTAITTTSVSITTGEVGIMTTITDALTEDDIVAGLAPYAMQLGHAMADKEDADIAALLGGFSNETAPAGGVASDFTADQLLEAIEALDSRDTPAGSSLVAVLHTKQAHEFKRDVRASSNVENAQVGDSRFGNSGRGFIGNWYGVDIYQTTNVPQGTRSATSVYTGALFTANQALGFLAEREARTELERDASARVTEVVASARYGVGELVDSYGQGLYSQVA